VADALAVVELCQVPFDHPDAVTLIAAAQRVYLHRYGTTDESPVDPAEFTPPHGCFVVGYLDGVPVACGGWRRCHAGADPQLRDGDAELKRMFVVGAQRRRGHARAVLAELERSARQAGCGRIVLETGSRQPEAVALYRAAGFLPIRTFGLYRDQAGCRCFAKPLPVAPGGTAVPDLACPASVAGSADGRP